MKRLLLAAGLLLAFAAPAFAACPFPLTGKDASGTSQNFNAINDGNNNCNGSVSIVQLGTNPTSTLTLPATTTAYTAGSNMATSATGTSAVVSSFSILVSGGVAQIPRVRLDTNDTTSTAWGTQVITIDLWSAAPTFASANGDRGVFKAATGSASHLGSFNCVMSAVQGDGYYSECFPNVGNFVTVKLASGSSVYWTATAASGSGVTGASKVFTLTAEVSN